MPGDHEPLNEQQQQGQIPAEGEALGDDNRDVRQAAADEQPKLENEGLGGHGADAGEPTEEP